jgi:uncharacterized membrane protein YjjB (DUF3815 family)
MIIIPGLAIGTSIRDIMTNDVLSGSVRLFQTIVISAAIAAGFSFAAKLYGGEVMLNSNASWYIMLITTFVATIGFGIMFNNSYGQLPIVAVGSVIATCAYIFTLKGTDNIFLSVMLGTITATILAEILARIVKAPTTVFLIPIIIPFVPGASLFFMMHSVVNGNMELFQLHGINLLLASLGIAVGIIFASVFVQIVLRIIKKIKNKNA